MTSYRRSHCAGRHDLAAEPGGAYETGPGGLPDPLGRMVGLLDELEEAKRRVLDGWRDVAAWGGTVQTTGLSQGEWLALRGRASGFEARRLEVMTRRLPGLPVTAGLLAAGTIGFEQAAAICTGTTSLTGDALACVERDAGRLAADRNRRGDDPDIGADIDQLVQRRRRPRDLERAERRRVEGATVWTQQSLDGGGALVFNGDPEGYSTVLAAVEDAAGPPTPGVGRRQQRAEGLVAIARAWLAATGTAPTHTAAAAAAAAPASGATTSTHPDGIDPALSVRLGAATARPTLVARVDIADADPSAFAALWRTGSGGRAPLLGARLADMLACNADLLLTITQGRRPIAELRDRTTLPAVVRRQVLCRDLGCRWPGCTRPPWQCDVHHITHRADGGDHHVDNAVALCRTHHVRLHGTHWSAALDGATGAFMLARTPGGRPHHTTLPHGTHTPGTPADAGGDPTEVPAPR